jgi:alpha-L-fucosidase
MKSFAPFLASLACAAVFSSLHGESTPPPAPAVAASVDPEKAARLAWWHDAKFGLFIHWGLYSVPAGQWQDKTNLAEWFQQETNMPVDEYAKFADQFNPVKYDPDAWVRLAKEAGMKYIVITSKHHDGFCLFETKATNFNAARATPYGRDLLKPLADACRKYGIKFCTYYSIMDWHNPDQAAGAKGYNPTVMLPDRKADYVAYMKQELTELVTIHGTELIWFDGEWPEWWTNDDGRDLYAYLRSLKPSLIINNRVGKGRKGMEGMDTNENAGDYGTPEQQIPARGFGPGVFWESCMTMNKHWGYNRVDQDWKSPATLVRNLIDIASKGGNFLLNVGPTGEGEFPAASIERLRAIGAWLKINGQAIYGAGPTPFGAEAGYEDEVMKDPKTQRPLWVNLEERRCTTQPGKLYFHLLKWPAGSFTLPNFPNKVLRAHLLADPKQTSLAVSLDGRGKTIALPDRPPAELIPVLCVEIEGSVNPDRD